MVYQLIAPFIISLIILLGTICGIIAYRIRRKALNPPPTIDDIIARQEAELDKVNKEIMEG